MNDRRRSDESGIHLVGIHPFFFPLFCNECLASHVLHRYPRGLPEEGDLNNLFSSSFYSIYPLSYHFIASDVQASRLWVFHQGLTIVPAAITSRLISFTPVSKSTVHLLKPAATLLPRHLV